jgi:hypothetical protein
MSEMGRSPPVRSRVRRWRLFGCEAVDDVRHRRRQTWVERTQLRTAGTAVLDLFAKIFEYHYTGEIIHLLWGHPGAVISVIYPIHKILPNT